MALNYGYFEDEWEAEDWYEPGDGLDTSEYNRASPPIDVIALTAVILVILTLFFALKQFTWNSGSETVISSPNTSQVQSIDEGTKPLEAPVISSPSSIIAPYDNYIITQGIHGLSYGHMAIDIAAGKGETVKSPITGTVTEFFFDAIGNSTLVIENEFYRITMLHGNYSVEIGQELQLGDPIGTEGNLGNTRDMQGRSCRGRDCGYHTHLNVFDKQLGSNINPLELIES